MSALPLAVHSVAQVRAMDRYAIEQLDIPRYTLMTRAAEAALLTLRSEWPRGTRVLMICGAGNNAGDGYVMARLARAARLQVNVIALADPQLFRRDAHQAWTDLRDKSGANR